LRYFFYISYKGTNYHGWQVQPNANTVQAEINKALSTLFQTKIETIGSGRTDTGVHAKEQVFHGDIPGNNQEEILMHRMNSLLPADIVVNKILLVKKEAHARFDAMSRSYEYHLHFKRSPFKAKEFLFLPKTPDFEQMNLACNTLLGEQDFTSFSKVQTEVNNFYCYIKRAEWQLDDGKGIFYVTANRFLRGMVRALVGTLLNVGYGKTGLEEFAEIIKAKDRTVAGQSVPPQGLYLCDVRYPSEVFIK
jgi:tRNA pseudouridine38-40 synthase